MRTHQTISALIVATGLLGTGLISCGVTPSPGGVDPTPPPSLSVTLPASADLSSVSVSPASGVVADGVQKATISIVIKDTASKVKPNLTVHISATGAGNSFSQNDIKTDANGAVSIDFMSTIAEEKEISVVAKDTSDIGLSQKPHVIFAPTVTAVQVSAGITHTCAVLTSGIVKCFGSNAHGNLGNGNAPTMSTVPSLVSGITNAVKISAGNDYSCAVLQNGVIKCWGYNNYGQLGNGITGTDSYTPVQVLGISTAVDVAVSDFHTCALLADKTIQCWGNNAYGQLGNGNTTDTNQPIPLSGITNAKGVAVSLWSTCILLENEQVRCLGHNGQGQLGDGTFTNRSAPVAVRDLTNSAALTGAKDLSGKMGGHFCATVAPPSGSDRYSYCWGFNYSGALGNGTLVNSNLPVVTQGIATAKQSASGGEFSCSLLSDGSGKCWGNNSSGSLGNGTTNSSYVTAPVVVNALSGAKAISVGYLHACAILADASVSCWGNNVNGQLGIGTSGSSAYKTSPTPVTTLLQ